MCRRVIARVLLIVVSTGFLAACGPRIPNGPDTYRGSECAYAAEIMDGFAGTGSERWAVDVAMRESRCEPCAFWPGRVDCGALPTTAKGLFQLEGHDDLLEAACPGDRWAWRRAECNITAARWLFDGSGRRPWGG
jgi:hypothetical protein